MQDMIQEMQNEMAKRDEIARDEIEEWKRRYEDMERRLAESESQVELLTIKLGVASGLDQVRPGSNDQWSAQRTASEVKKTLHVAESEQLEYMTRTKLLENKNTVVDNATEVEGDSEEVSDVVRGIMEAWLQRSCNETVQQTPLGGVETSYQVSASGANANGFRISHEASFAMREAQQLLGQIQG